MSSLYAIFEASFDNDAAWNADPSITISYPADDQGVSGVQTSGITVNQASNKTMFEDINEPPTSTFDGGNTNYGGVGIDILYGGRKGGAGKILLDIGGYYSGTFLPINIYVDNTSGSPTCRIRHATNQSWTNDSVTNDIPNSIGNLIENDVLSVHITYTHKGFYSPALTYHSVKIDLFVTRGGTSTLIDSLVGLSGTTLFNRDMVLSNETPRDVLFHNSTSPSASTIKLRFNNGSSDFPHPKKVSYFHLPPTGTDKIISAPRSGANAPGWNHPEPPPGITISSSTVSSGDTSADSSITVTFTCTGSTTDFAASDVTVSNGTLSNFSGSGANYTATFTPSGTLTGTPPTLSTSLLVAANTFTINSVNNEASDTFTWTYRNVTPIPNVNYTNTNRNSGGIRQFIDDYISDSTVAKFADATQNTYYGPIEQWDTSQVTNMSNAFNGVSNASTQNYDVSNWDTSSVTSMERMFYNNDGFNRDIGSWDVSNVENMHSMFYGCAIFNQNLGSWDVSSVTKMRLMFVATNNFNNGGSDSIKNWDVSSVTGDDGFQQMFQSAATFNQPINDWDVSSGTNFDSMFNSADDFIQLLPDWDMSNATNTSLMFTEYTGDNTSGTANTNGSMSNYLSLLDGGSLSIVSNRINYVTAAKVAFYSPTQTNYLGANIGNNPDTTFPTITIAAGYGSNALVHLISGITTTSTTNFAVTFAQTSSNVYEEQGASATDNVNSNMTVTVGGDTVNTAVTGTYVVTYTANDNYNERVRTKTITVTDDYTPFKSGMTMKSNAIRGLYNSVCRAAIGFATSGNIQIKTHEDVVGFTIDGSNGRFGSGTASPEETFHSTSCKINETVSVVQLTGASDRRLKTDIQNIDDSRGIYDLEPVQYNWERNPDGSVHFGFIAQELKKRYPNLVKVDSTGLHSIDYLGLVPLMIKELKGQFEKVEKLTDEMKYLKDLLDNVE